jgi:hypothetical protein
VKCESRRYNLRDAQSSGQDAAQGTHVSRSVKLSGWPSFALWALIGVMYALACLAMTGIGMGILLIAVATTIAAGRNLEVWPDITGLATGPALVLAWVGLRSWSLPLCGPGEGAGVALNASASSSIEVGSMLATERIAECTAIHASPLLCAALVLFCSSLMGYVLIARHLSMADAVSSPERVR